jgi:hypothetical protein
VCGFQLPAGKVLDPSLVTKLAKDVLPCVELRRTVDELDGRASACELEGIQGPAVATTDDRHDVTPGEAVQHRLELVRDVSAECSIGSGLEELPSRACSHDQGPAGQSPAVDFDRTPFHIHRGHGM